MRNVTPELDTARNICALSYRLDVTRAGEVKQHYEETHRMRYFFPDELESMLAKEGLALMRLAPFPNVDETLNDSTWNALGVARAT